jgi:hypothetical protein
MRGWGLSFIIAAGPRQRSHSRYRVPHISLSLIRDYPNMKGKIPVFISSRNRMVQSEGNVTAGGLPPISSSWRQAP